jgi:chromosome segregation ATPase
MVTEALTNELSKANANLKTQNDNLTLQLSKVNAETNELSKANTTLKKQNDNLTLQLSKVNAETDALRGQIRTLESKPSNESALATKETELLELTRKCERLQNELKQQSAQSELDLLFAEQSTLRTEIAELKAARKLDAQAFKRESLSLNSQIRRLEAEKSALQDRATSAEAEKAAISNEINSLRRMLQSQLSDLHSVKRELHVERGQNEALRGQQRQFAVRAEEAEAQLLDLQKHNDTLRTHFKDAVEADALREELQIRTLELEQTQANIRAAQKQNQDLRKRLDEVREKAALRKEEIVRLREGMPSLSEFREKIEELREELKRMREYVEKTCSGREWATMKEEAAELDATERERRAEIENKARLASRRAKKAERKLAEEIETNEALTEKVEAFTGLELKHRKALRLLGEYHCRIQALTGPGLHRIERMNITK